jgi:hypothetical protein
MRLDADFAAAGPLHAHVRTSFGLSAAEFDRIAANVKSSAKTPARKLPRRQAAFRRRSRGLPA